MTKKIIFFGFILVNVFVILYLVYFNKEDEATSFLTIDKNYSYIYNEEFQINYPVFYNHPENRFKTLKDIGNISIHDVNQTKKITLEPIDVRFLGERYFSNSFYYLYSYTLKIPNLQNDFSIEAAYLTIINKLEEKITIYLGEFKLSFQNDLGKASHLTIDDLYAITNPVNNCLNLAGLIIKINPKNNFLRINDIILSNSNAFIDAENILKLRESEYAQTTNIEEILGKNYSFSGTKKAFKDFSLEKSEYFLLPVKYTKAFLLDTSYIVIKYLFNGDEYSYYLDNFNFFMINDLNLIEGVLRINALK